MKQIRPLSLLVLLMVGKPAWAQFSSGPETETKQALARINGIGHLEVAELIAVPVCEFQEATRTVTVQVAKVEVYSVDVEIDGRKLPETRTRTVCVPEQRQETYLRRNCKLVVKQAQHFCALDDRNGTFVRGSDHREIKLFEIDGTPVAPAQLGHRLKDWTLVLLTHNGQMAAGLYSGLYKPGTLVIAIPAPLQMAPTPPPQPDNVPPPPVAAPQPTPIPIAAPAPQPAADESRFNFPAGVPPTTVFSRVTGDSIVVRYHTDVTEFTSLLSKVSKTVDGKEVWEEIRLPVEHTDRKSQVWKIPVSSVRGWSGDGTALSPAKLREKLNVEIPVLATVGNRDIDPFWFQNLKPESIVLSTPLPDDAALAPSAPPTLCVPTPAPVQAPAVPAAPVAIPGAPQAAAPSPTPTPTARKPQEPPRFLSAVEQHLWTLTNQQRKEQGVPELVANEQLCQVARKHAARMAALGTLDHTLDGITFDKRIEATGYRCSAAGENISNAPSAELSLAGWMKSPGHRGNILSPGYTEVGVATATSANDRRYWVQVFATPANQ